MIDPKRVLDGRICPTERAMQSAYQMMYRIRRVVAGDREALKTSGISTNYDDVTSALLSRSGRQDYPDVMIREVDEGINNALLKFIDVLVEQTHYSAPKIEIKGPSAKQKIVNGHYLMDILDRSNFLSHNKISLWDYLMGGIGDMYISNYKGRPDLRWADTLDMKWDQIARLPCDVKWKSITVCESFETWKKTFGNKAFDSYFGPADGNKPGMDMPFELEFYYDVDSDETGAYMVFISLGNGQYDPTPVYAGKNPNYTEIQGKREPFLPFEPIFYMAIPSVKQPMGAAQKAFPAQIAVWSGIERLQEIWDGGSGFYEIDEAALSDKNTKGFLEAQKDGIVFVKELGRIVKHDPMSFTPTDVEEITRNLTELAEQLGSNSYALGQPVKGVKYAKEVGAIQGQGALTAGMISKDNASRCARLAKKLVAKGKAMDKNPFSCQVEGVQMDFGPGQRFGELREYLRPDADFLIAEDSMRFQPQMARLQLDGAVMDRAMQVARVFPVAVKLSFERFLTTAGVENVDAWTEAPQANPQEAMPGQAVAIEQQGLKGGAIPS